MKTVKTFAEIAAELVEKIIEWRNRIAWERRP